MWRMSRMLSVTLSWYIPLNIFMDVEANWRPSKKMRRDTSDTGMASSMEWFLVRTCVLMVQWLVEHCTHYSNTHSVMTIHMSLRMVNAQWQRGNVLCSRAIRFFRRYQEMSMSLGREAEVECRSFFRCTVMYMTLSRSELSTITEVTFVCITTYVFSQVNPLMECIPWMLVRNDGTIYMHPVMPWNTTKWTLLFSWHTHICPSRVRSPLWPNGYVPTKYRKTDGTHLVVEHIQPCRTTYRNACSVDRSTLPSKSIHHTTNDP